MAAHPGQSIGSFAVRSDVTPSDTVDLPSGMCRALVASTGGDIAFVNGFGLNDVVTVADNEIALVLAQRVLATNTTAAGIKACY